LTSLRGAYPELAEGLGMNEGKRPVRVEPRRSTDVQWHI
jgi:hypothetical protein